MIRTFLLCALAATALTGLAACGGDDDDAGEDDATSEATSGAATRTATSGGNAASPSPDSGGDDSDDDDEDNGDDATTESGGGDQDAIDDFGELSKKGDEATYTATYAVSFESGDETSEGTWTIAQDPPRSLVKFDVDGQKVWAIDDGEDSYSCFEVEGTSGQCLKAGVTDALDDGTIDPDDAVAAAEESSDFKEVDGRTIAGRDARCFEFSGDTADEGGLMCVDEDDGIMLLLESAGSRMEATDVSDDVSDESFEPPFDVIG